MKQGNNNRYKALAGIMLLMLAFGVSFPAGPMAFAFNGPANGQAAGSGSGAIGVGSNQNISIGTSTTQASTKMILVASSTGDTANYALKVLDSSQNPLLIIRNDGSVGIGTASFADTGLGALNVAGLISSNDGFTGNLSAANVSAGTFGSNTGSGNYSFPGNVGIGTTANNGKLSIVADTGTDPIGWQVGSAGAWQLGPNAGAGTNDEKVGLFSYTYSENHGNSYQPMQLWDSTDSDIALLPGGGDVGIGTASPASLLTLNGGGTHTVNVFSGSSYNYLTLNGVTSNTGTLVGIGGGGGTDANLYFYSGLSGGGATMVLVGANVGIGTASPGNALGFGSQYDSIGWNGGSGAIIDNDGYGTRLSMLDASVIRLTNDNYGSGGGSTGLFVTGDDVGIGTVAPPTRLDVNAGTNEDFDVTGPVANASGITLNAANDAYSANVPVEIRASETTLGMEGDVGINTTNPTSTLSVNGNTSISGNLSVGGTFGGQALTGTLSAGNVSQGEFGYNTSGGNYEFPAGISVNGTAPTALYGLTAYGTLDRGIDAQISGTSADNYGVIGVASGAGATNIGVYAGANSGTGSNFAFYIPATDPNAGTNNYAIYSAASAKSYFAGNVGIGTGSPYTNLTVDGTYNGLSLTHATPAIASFQPGSVGTDLVVGGNSGSPYTMWMQVRNITGDGDDYPLALNPLGGNVGIGTTNPGFTLDVAGDERVASGDSSFTYYGPNASWGGMLYVGATTVKETTNTAQVIATDGNLHLDSGSNGKAVYIQYYSGQNTYINTSGGDVGIGTTNPYTGLTVDGTYGAPSLTHATPAIASFQPGSVGTDLVVGGNSGSSV